MKIISLFKLMTTQNIILLIILFLSIYYFMKINSKEGFISKLRAPMRNFRLKRQSFGKNLKKTLFNARRKLFRTKSLLNE
jgi:hypothetical protein